MKIIIFGSPKKTQQLSDSVGHSIEELGLTDFIKVEKSQDEAVKKELSIEEEPALIVEEEAIDFKDTIFQGIIPSESEIKSMLISIIGGDSEGGSCGISGGCPSGCSC